MDIILINNPFLQSATYLIDDYLIDCGDPQQIFEALGNRELKGIFLTHCHQDHVYGIEQVLQKYSNAMIYCSEKTLKGLKDPHLNLSYIMPDYSFTFNKDENVTILTEGTYQIGDLRVEVLSTVGHSEDCVSFIIEDNVFTGDAHVPFAKVFTKWPTSNRMEAVQSEQKLLDIIKERDLNVFPGHWK